MTRFVIGPDVALQRVAWTMAERFGWPDTLDAEYVALTRLQSDALVTLDARLAAAEVVVAPYAALRGDGDRLDHARGT